jgi:hypothetical protein
MTRRRHETAAALKLIRFESIYPWPDWPFAALAILNPTTGKLDHQHAFNEGARYALAQIEDIHKMLSIPPVPEFQDYIRSADISRSLSDEKGVLVAATHVTNNTSVYSSFWMGGRYAIDSLLQGPIPVNTRMEGLLQCLACLAEGFRAVYEKLVQEHGVQPEVDEDWTCYA